MAQDSQPTGALVSTPEIEIGIVNQRLTPVTICRRDPESFMDRRLLDLAAKERRRILVRVDDYLVAKVDDQVVAEFGVSAELPLWQIGEGNNEGGTLCQFLVRNNREESVMLVCTDASGREIETIPELEPKSSLVRNSFTNHFWEAKFGERVISVYQPSARLPVWEFAAVDCDFVPKLPLFGYEDLNDSEIPRTFDLRSTGRVKAVMVFVDFADAPGTMTPREAMEKISGGTDDWFRRESYGRFEFSVDAPVLRWRRMPLEATAYREIGAKAAEHLSYITTALKLFSADEINFDDYQLVYVVAAATPEALRDVLHNSPTLSNGNEIATNNGVVKHVVTFGRDSYTRTNRVLIHETGHLLGLPDLYRFPCVHGADDYLMPTGAWDIMCDLDNGRHFLGWHKYKLGWLDDSQLHYFNSGELTATVSSLESAHGLKMIVLPSEHSSRVLVIEAAQPLGDRDEFSSKGILIYSVDAAVGTGHEPVKLFACGAAVDNTQVGVRSGDFLAVGESLTVKLSNGNLVEITNLKQAEGEFDVNVKLVGLSAAADMEPSKCSNCGRPMR